MTVGKHLSVFPKFKAIGFWYPSLVLAPDGAVRYAESGGGGWAKCHTDRAILRAVVAVAGHTAVIPRISSGRLMCTPCTWRHQ